MGDADWSDPPRAAIAFRLDGDAIEEDAVGSPATSDDSFLILMNGEREATDFVLPSAELGEAWRVAFDTCAPPKNDQRLTAGQTVRVDAGGLVVMREERDSQEGRKGGR
jgi:pullulanase/glycogen debranching enzyme